MGILSVFTATVFSLTAYSGIAHTGEIVFMSVICAIVAVMSASSAVLLIGMAIRQPTALRMDAKGISGFYMAPAHWSEISKVGIRVGSKRKKSLGFTLHDHISFRDRQTAFQRFLSWLNGVNSGYHLVVPGAILKGADVDDLARQAQTFLIAAHKSKATVL